MAKQIEPYRTLVDMPSLRAVKYFVAAAKYQNFTRAAEALCVTQAAISRQIRELEASLGVSLFTRSGRAVELTEEGAAFYDAAYLSFLNISQAAERIGTDTGGKALLTICCSPAFSSFWLSRRLPDFVADNPGIDINIVSTMNFTQMEPGVFPDIMINMSTVPCAGYHTHPLFYDVIYPVCSPVFLERNPAIADFGALKESSLLNLTPFGRTKVAEHVDWRVWFELQSTSSERNAQSSYHFQANDYVMLIQMALSHQGVSLGWDHLVRPLVEEGLLVRPVPNEVAMKERRHFIFYRADNEDNEPQRRFCDWMISCLQE